jgi:MFS transporter, SP family, arabinose:H+ symporter
MSVKPRSKYLFIIASIASAGGLLFGFDIAVVSGVLPFVQEQFHLTAVEEGWFVSSALIGSIAGVAISGELSDRFGRKILLVLSSLLFFISSLGCTLLPSAFWIIAFRMLGGVGIGVTSIIVPLYISEIAPAAIRGRLVTFYQLAITIGILFAYLSNGALLNISLDKEGSDFPRLLNFLFVEEVWRGMFSVLILPSLLFLTGLILVPESPRWLIQKKRTEEAINIITKISGDRYQSEAEVREITSEVKAEIGSYKELLSPSLRKALILGILLPFLSQFSGINAIIYYGPTILHSAGVTISNSFMSQIIFGFAIVLFTLIAIWKVDDMGRRRLYLIGTAGAAISLFLTGICFYFQFTSSIWLIVCVLFFLASFAFSIGPLKFVVASEIFPNKIRGRAMAISIMTMWIADTMVGQLTPIALNEIGTAATFWFFSFFCIIGFFFVLRFLPETKGKSLEQIQRFWKQTAIV